MRRHAQLAGGLVALLGGVAMMWWIGGQPSPGAWLFFTGGVLVFLGTAAAAAAVLGYFGRESAHWVMTVALFVAGVLLYKLSPVVAVFGDFWPSVAGNVMTVLAIFGGVFAFTGGRST